MITLNTLPTGINAVITKVGGEGVLRCRLLDMGIIPRTRIVVRSVAPLGDPMEIRLRDYTLTLRMEDAAQIEVEPLEVTDHDLCSGRKPELRKNNTV